MTTFVSRIITNGQDRFLLYIPKDQIKQVKPLKGKQVKVTIETI